MSSLFRRNEGAREENWNSTDNTEPSDAVIVDGDYKYIDAQGGNDAPPAYQEGIGAPIEKSSPLGYGVGPTTLLFLNLSKMVGTGIFSTPSGILRGTGSVGASLLVWAFGYLVTLSSLTVFLEYVAYLPSRSGSEVAYLEQAYPRPKWFFPTAYAVQTVLFSFSSSNAIVMARYLFATGGYVGSDWEIKGLAIGCYSLAFLFVLFNTKFSYYASNTIGGLKMITLIFIALTGLVVLGGHTRVEDPGLNFRNAFDGDPTPYGITNAMYRIVFSYRGWENAFNVVNEIKDPVKNMKWYGYGGLSFTAVMYMLANIAYFSALPQSDIIESGEIAAGLFFEQVFGTSAGRIALNFLIAFSAFGNLIAVLLGDSRLIRECGRQGVLPFPGFWASTKPFGTPAGPYFVKWFATTVMILAVPAGDAFNFVLDLGTYPAAVFTLLLAIGIYAIRYRRRNLALPPPTFRTPHVVLIFNILVQLYLIIMPWYPPLGGATGGNVSFWYATYVVVGIGLLSLCGIYYIFWIILIPKWKGYKVRQEIRDLGNGAQSHFIVKVPLDQVSDWDRRHGPDGATQGSSVGGDASSQDAKTEQGKAEP